MIKILVHLTCLFSMLGIAVHARNDGFKLTDKICIVVEGEDSITLSEIHQRKQQKEISFADAKNELLRERLVWVYAKKQKIKYDLAAIAKNADEHINRVMTSNKFTREQLNKALEENYKSNFETYRKETQTAILENIIKQNISSQISLSDEFIIEEARKKFAVVIISISPSLTNKKAQKNSTSQLQKANAIRAEINAHATINGIKTKYRSAKDVKISEPEVQEKGDLIEAYEAQLDAHPNDMVVGPFNDDKNLTLIWRVKKNIDGTALEKQKKESNNKAVLEKYNASIDAQKNESTVIDKDCGEL